MHSWASASLLLLSITMFLRIIIFMTLLTFNTVGETTKRLAQELERHGHNVEYVFTDISPTLVSRVRKTMQEYKWTSFKVTGLTLCSACWTAGGYARTVLMRFNQLIIGRKPCGWLALPRHTIPRYLGGI